MVLPAMQAALNGGMSTSTTKSANELAFGIKTREGLELMLSQTTQDFACKIEAQDALAFAAKQTKTS